MDRFTRFSGLDPVSGRSGASGNSSLEETPQPNPFERLIEIVRSNDQASTTLASLQIAIDRARGYLASHGCHRTIGEANLNRLKIKRSCVLDLLRANRIEVRKILAGLGRSAVVEFRTRQIDHRDGWAIRAPQLPRTPAPLRQRDSGFIPARR